MGRNESDNAKKPSIIAFFEQKRLKFCAEFTENEQVFLFAIS